MADDFTELSTICLFCGFEQKFHVNPDPDGKAPQPGDICICFECGYVAAYGDDLQLIALNEQQQKYTETNPEFKVLMASLREMKDEDEDARTNN